MIQTCLYAFKYNFHGTEFWDDCFAGPAEDKAVMDIVARSLSDKKDELSDEQLDRPLYRIGIYDYVPHFEQDYDPAKNVYPSGCSPISTDFKLVGTVREILGIEKGSVEE